MSSPGQTAALSARRSGPLRGRIRAPGDKSISHRALIFGALAEGLTEVEGLLEGEDVLRSAAAMRAFGAEVEALGGGRWRVLGRGGFSEPDDVIDCGNAGTGVRLILGAAAGFDLSATFTGDASLRGRPMNRVMKPLSEMGARFLGRSGGRLPLTLRGGSLKRIEYVLPEPSAQVKSAVLLAGLHAAGGAVVIEPEPTRDHTERMLRGFGAEVIIEELPEGRLTTLREMGADLSVSAVRDEGGEPVGDITARHSALRGVDVPADRAPSMIDEYPILAVAAAFAEGVTRMRGIGEMRVKESDRIALMAAGLAACGLAVEEEPEGLIVTGAGANRPPVGGAAVRTRGDHRIAMSHLVLGLAADAVVRVDEPGMIATSFPGFVDMMGGLGADISPA